MCKRGEKPPEHMANSLYLEWFSEATTSAGYDMLSEESRAGFRL